MTAAESKQAGRQGPHPEREPDSRLPADDELQEAEERFRQAFEHAPIGMALVSPEGRFLRVNRSMCAIVGYEERELLDKDFQGLTHPVDVDLDLEYRRQTLAGERRTYQMEKRYFDAEGQVVWVSLSVSLVRDSAGEPRHFIAQVQDIGERKEIEEAVQASERRFRGLTNHAPVGIFETDAEGHCRFVNQRWCELSGMSAEVAVDGHAPDAVHPEDREVVVNEWLAATEEGREWEMEFRFLAPDGRVCWVAASAVPLRDSVGQITGYLGTCLDITERKQLEARLLHLASHDEMTGLPNRRRFDDELRRQVEYARRYEHSAALMVLDLDNFKEINDSLGHHAGDQLVKGVAARLRRRLRATDLLARIGGDEFAVFLPQAAPGEAERVAAEIVDLIAAEPIVVGPNALSTRASVGVALQDPEHPLDPERLLIQADLAMYEAKNAGGDRHAVAAPSAPAAS